MHKVISFDLPLKVVGHGHAAPARTISNLDLLRLTPIFRNKTDAFLEKVEERMIQGFGFKNRRMVRLPTEPIDIKMPTSEDLGLAAARFALNSYIQPDILVHGTTTSSRYTGSQAAALAGKLGFEIPAYETKAGCSTGLAGLHLAYSLLNAGYSRALCCFAETLSKVIDGQNPESWFGLADGAAALHIEKTSPTHASFIVKKSTYFTDGRHVNLFSTQGHLPPSAGASVDDLFVLRGDAEALRQQALIRYSDLINEVLTPDERSRVRWIFCHQVNRQLIRDVLDRDPVSGDIYWINQDFGNIGGTTIPFALSVALDEQIFKKGDLIFLMSVGGGVTAAAQLWEWRA